MNIIYSAEFEELKAKSRCSSVLPAVQLVQLTCPLVRTFVVRFAMASVQSVVLYLGQSISRCRVMVFTRQQVEVSQL